MSCWTSTRRGLRRPGRALAPFAELVKSPEHIHTYRLTPLSIWNARAAGLAAAQMVAALSEHTRYAIPPNVEPEILELASRYGRVVITRDGDRLRCTCSDDVTAERLARDRDAGRYLAVRIDATTFHVDAGYRGVLKQALTVAGFPAEDLAGYTVGEPLPVVLRENGTFAVRDYQRQAAEAFYLAGSERGGSGVIVLPCGAGKTIVGLAAMALVGQTALVLTSSLTAVHQWRRELLDKTRLRPGDIAEYTGERKDTGPVTLTTYQILTCMIGRMASSRISIYSLARSWGLIIYDEVHCCRRPYSAPPRTCRRAGGCFSPQPWCARTAAKLTYSLSSGQSGSTCRGKIWSARRDRAATCIEERLPMRGRAADGVRPCRPQVPVPDRRRESGQAPRLREILATYATGRNRNGRVASCRSVEAIAREIGAPLITGRTPQAERESIFGGFRRNGTPLVQRLQRWQPRHRSADADGAHPSRWQPSSRQRKRGARAHTATPADGRAAHFFTLVSRDTREEEFAHQRKLFLTEQGYSYQVVVAGPNEPRPR